MKIAIVFLGLIFLGGCASEIAKHKIVVLTPEQTQQIREILKEQASCPTGSYAQIIGVKDPLDQISLDIRCDEKR